VKYDFDLFVIGGGSGGVRCARIAASLGASVAVAEEKFWGGTCVNVGCVPKKLMVMAAEYGNHMPDSAGFGWTTQPGSHDWQALIATKNGEISRLNGIYANLLGGVGVKSFEARATFIDDHTLDVGGQRVTAERIVIAAGGRPTAPKFKGAEYCIVSDDAFFLPEMPKRVALLGGGYIAVEFAGIFAGLGAEVDLIMRQDLPLRGFDEDLRLGLLDALRDGGVRVHTGSHVTCVTAQGDTKIVHLPGGGEVRADLVFAAIGRTAHTNGLGLDKAGVEISAQGAVMVHPGSVTNVAHIYAIGDVTDRLNLTPVAIAEGHSLAEALYGNGPREWHLDRVATAVFSIPPIATVGPTEEQAVALSHSEGPFDVYISRFIPMRHTMSGRARKTLMKLIVNQASQKVVAAHMIGEDAPEIMQGISIAINTGATKADFDRTVGIHPTAAEEFVTMRTRTRVAG
jgi:glutathione reductase (NADPH)